MKTLTARLDVIKSRNLKAWVTTQNVEGVTYTHVDTNCMSFCPKCFTETVWVEVFAGENYSHDECSSCGCSC